MWASLILGGQIVVALLYILFLRHSIKARRHFLQSQQWVYLAIRSPKSNLQSTLAVEQVFAQLHVIATTPAFWDKHFRGRVPLWYSFEIVSAGGQTSFLARTSKQHCELFLAALYAQYPDVEINQVDDYLGHTIYHDTASFDLWGAEINLTENSVLPIRTYRDFEHPAAAEKIIDPLRSPAKISCLIFRFLFMYGDARCYRHRVDTNQVPRTGTIDGRANATAMGSV